MSLKKYTLVPQMTYAEDWPSITTANHFQLATINGKLFEAYLAETDARNREHQLKYHGQAKARLKKRISASL